MNTSSARSFIREADKALRKQLGKYKEIHGLTPACAACKGHHCCEQQIHIYPPEVDNLVKYIRENGDRKAIDESLLSWVEEFLSWDLDTQADESKHFFKGLKCPFYIDNKCAVYAARPIACRSYYSLEEDEEKCKGDEGDTHVLKMLDTSMYHKFFLDQGLWTLVMPLIVGGRLWEDNPTTQKAAGMLQAYAVKVQGRWFELKHDLFAARKAAEEAADG